MVIGLEPVPAIFKVSAFQTISSLRPTTIDSSVVSLGYRQDLEEDVELLYRVGLKQIHHVGLKACKLFRYQEFFKG